VEHFGYQILGLASLAGALLVRVKFDTLNWSSHVRNKPVLGLERLHSPALLNCGGSGLTLTKQFGAEGCHQQGAWPLAAIVMS
jgi:hypothetical protein